MNKGPAERGVFTGETPQREDAVASMIHIEPLPRNDRRPSSALELKPKSSGAAACPSVRDVPRTSR